MFGSFIFLGLGGFDIEGYFDLFFGFWAEGMELGYLVGYFVMGLVLKYLVFLEVDFFLLEFFGGLTAVCETDNIL